MPVRRILLVGGGHGHLEVLRRFALQPDAGIELTLGLSAAPCAPYSPMLAEVVAGHCSVGGVADRPADAGALGRRALRLRPSDRNRSLCADRPLGRRWRRAVRPAVARLGAFPDYRVSGRARACAAAASHRPFPGRMGALEADVDARRRAHRRRRRRGCLRRRAAAGDAIPACPECSREGTRFALVSDAAASPRRADAGASQAPRQDPRRPRCRAAPGTVVDRCRARRRRDLDRPAHRRRPSRLGDAPQPGRPGSRRRPSPATPAVFCASAPRSQSVSDPFVFGVGRCSTQEGATAPHGRARFAGPTVRCSTRTCAVPLATSRWSRGGPAGRMLSVIAAGSRHAVASWGPVAARGRAPLALEGAA